uniref:Uncharacterized protein n=1 Tax=Candidatus Kentrum sp. DK TaxID=2126562 RepID=A0A450SBN8_9GAMM|nr:MAG: hypothetical protein BECKDK2373C_GA0170839_102641 [Candidatus Kentron sp. DK]
MRKITTIVSGTLMFWLVSGLMATEVMAQTCWPPVPCSDINVKENIADVDVDEVLAALF